MATPVLNLDTMVDRPTVVIDKVAYPLRSIDDFSILEFKRHARETVRFDELMKLDESSVEQDEEFSALADRYCRRILKAPADIHDKLDLGHRLQVITVFLQLLGVQRRLTTGARPTPATTETSQTPAAKTGAPLLPVSSGSTEGIH